MKTIVAITWCAEHFKGGDRINQLPGPEHAEWLEQAVDYWREHWFPFGELIVCATGWRGITNVRSAPDCHERDVLWRVLRRVDYFIGVPENPGHQIGAALCIRQAIEAAHKWGAERLICTAEDVVPSGVIAGEGRLFGNAASRILDGLEAMDYCGERWGIARTELSAQFFACRPEALVGPFNPADVTGAGCIEAYLAQLLPKDRCCFLEGLYRTTHDHSTWTKWAKESTGL